MAQMNTFGAGATMKDVIRERANDKAIVDKLQTSKLNGRIVTATRAVPSAATDVLTGDAEGDVVIETGYIYTLYSVSGSLLWDKRALVVGW